MNTSSSGAAPPPAPLEANNDTSIGAMMRQKLPQEIYDLIEHHFYQLTFLPGYVYPLGKPHFDDPASPEAQDWARRAKARPELLRLSKDVYKRYRPRIYTENIVVWGSGQQTWRDRTSVFSGAQQKRMSIEIVFGRRDTKFLPEAERAKYRPRMPPSRKNRRGKILVVATEVERNESHKMTFELFVAWRLKFLECVSQSYPLDEMTIDFRQCHAPDGMWLGDQLVWNFALADHRKPNRVTIRAPDLEKKESMSRWLRGAGWEVVP
ncbi:MAG: hypothetical protein LQ339_004499 [Xanthoria mediterranea]|nr:MAG: hypothetical protein LQ339_004499 [Xanthoria mediterranea]